MNLLYLVLQNIFFWFVQVGSKSGGVMGYAPAVPDGYGICYNPMDNNILFALSAWNSCEATKSSRFQESLRQSLLDMRNELVQSQNSNL